MMWLSFRALPMLVAATLGLNPVLAYAFSFSVQVGNNTVSNQISGRPLVWASRGVVMSLNLGSPGSTLINGTTSWDANAEGALATWNTVVPNFFRVNTVAHNRCDQNDRFNTVAFDQDDCGDGFGDALAFTHTIYEGESTGGFFIVETDVLFNNNVCWNAYAGPIRRCQDRTTLHDLYRVALHEFGHVLGLDHPDEAGQLVAAIMHSSESDLDSLTPDDINGAAFLYGESSRLTLTVIQAGTGNGTVTSTPAGIDCGSVCSASYTRGTVVTLTATPTIDSEFTGWSHSCSVEEIDLTTGIGDCTVTLTADTTFTATFVRRETPGQSETRLGNISTRGLVRTGDEVLIGGLIITGTTPKTVVIRAIGPSLAERNVAGVLADPVLQLFSGATMIDTNSDWRSHRRAADLPSHLQPMREQEAAIMVTLPPGAYTAIVSGSGNTTGIALVEVFEVNGSESSRLGNISTRGLVRTGDEVLIGGLIITGTTPKTVVIRAIGPSLAERNVAGVLADPVLQLFSGATMIDTNSDWRSHRRAADLPSHLQPTREQEAAIMVTLPPGAYTAIVSGSGNTTGVALVEVFEIE